MQKKKEVFIGLLIAMVFVIPMIAAAPTLNTPVTGTNYTTLTVNCTTDVTTTATNYNVSIYYNASGGSAVGSTLLVAIGNTSGSQTEFTSSPSIEALTDGTSYNFTCYGDNGTNQVYSPGIEVVGIDNTAPTATITLLKGSRADFKGSQTFTWTTTDATSGVQTISAMVTSPNSDTCPIQSWTTSSGTDQNIVLDCSGTYTAAVEVTDNAGNTGYATNDTFTVYAPGYKDASSGAGTFSSFSIGGDTEAKGSFKNFAIIAIIILVIWALVSKKK